MILTMKKIFTLIPAIFLMMFVFGQVSPDKYWVQFTDKDNSPYNVNNPEAFLTQRSIDRRVKQGIAIVENDIPVNSTYIQAVKNLGATILTTSRWFNSVTVYTTDPAVVTAINNLPFVKSIQKIGGKTEADGSPDLSKKPFFINERYACPSPQDHLKATGAANSYDYGAAYNQIHMLNGEFLHNLGYDGDGMVIAVQDAGFENANNLPAFDSLWDNGRILGYKDFVEPSGVNIFSAHAHGTMVLSTMGGYLPGEYVGTAPQASYWLLRSEDGDTEYLIEELNWASAAEFADSVGADVINSSLGYTEFDDPSQNHTYEDMDGNTTPITIAADMAMSKGMIVVNSAGNSGNSPWHYIGAPADGDSVFSIGAVDENGNYASFSSVGPTYDGRLKPNVVAQGSGTAICVPGGGVSFGSGTSFSSPITAGMVACLWQVYPGARNMEVLQAIEKSASLYGNPDYEMGNGIPDYGLAYGLLTTTSPRPVTSSLEAGPNPFHDEITLTTTGGTCPIRRIDLINSSGAHVFSSLFNGQRMQATITPPAGLPKGIYLLRIQTDNQILSRKVIKE
jgi:hypothetical protein